MFFFHTAPCSLLYVGIIKPYKHTGIELPLVHCVLFRKLLNFSGILEHRLFYGSLGNNIPAF